MAGTNDLGSSDADLICANLEALHACCATEGVAHTVCLAVPPSKFACSEGAWPASVAEVRAAVNVRLAERFGRALQAPSPETPCAAVSTGDAAAVDRFGGGGGDHPLKEDVPPPPAAVAPSTAALRERLPPFSSSFVDVAELVPWAPGSALWEEDGLHMSAAGYRQLGSALAPRLQAELDATARQMLK